jgi:hypothetical protein
LREILKNILELIITRENNSGNAGLATKNNFFSKEVDVKSEFKKDKSLDENELSIEFATNKNLNLNKDEKKSSLISAIGLDLAFAKVGSWMMIFKSVLSFFISNETDTNLQKLSFLKIIDDLALKIRQQCQYSIHAQPGLNLRKPDDIASDIVHNMQAAKLGTEVYNFNAFIAPWIGILKIFLPYSNNKVFGLIPRLLDFVDSSGLKITNIFWNLRRITKSLIPYDGGIRSETLLAKQSEVRKLMAYVWRSFVVIPYNSILKFFLKENAKKLAIPIFEKDFYEQKQIKELFAKSIFDYFSNFKALFSKKYFSIHEKKLIDIGQEEPENSIIYVRSKLLSQVLGFWAGSLGVIFNSASIASGFVGNILNIPQIRQFSDTLTSQANALMSLVYITGEVPANINEYFKKRKLGIKNKNYNLVVAGIGALGMLNRIKYNPLFAYLFSALKIKPFLDKWDKLFKNFFLLFFSANRWVLHYDEKLSAERNSSYKEIEIAKKHDNFWKHLTLPFRVLIKDKDVVYTQEEILNKITNI